MGFTDKYLNFMTSVFIGIFMAKMAFDSTSSDSQLLFLAKLPNSSIDFKIENLFFSHQCLPRYLTPRGFRKELS